MRKLTGFINYFCELSSQLTTIGSGDYLKLKDELFGEETVASLYAKVMDFQSLKQD
jgi:hypothetical protein